MGRAAGDVTDGAEAALAVAREIAISFGQEAQSELRPTIKVDLETGSREQPLLVFSLLLDLEDDLDAKDYPMPEIAGLEKDLRARIANSAVHEWDWIVIAGTKAGAARP